MRNTIKLYDSAGLREKLGIYPVQLDPKDRRSGEVAVPSPAALLYVLELCRKSGIEAAAKGVQQ